MNRQTQRVDAANFGRRLETYVMASFPHVSRGTLMKLLRQGKIRLNGRKVKPMQRLADGDALEFPWGLHAEAPEQQTPQNSVRRAKKLPRLAIVYEDDDILIANKPAKLASHPGIKHEEDSLSARLVEHLQAFEAPVGRKPGLAQRLDADVTGVLACGKHAAALKTLMGPPHGPPLLKIYVAWVKGRVVEESGSLCWPLLTLDEPRGDRPKVVVDEASGRPARTDYRVLARREGRTLVRLILHTGRTHQIRAHLCALGHPIIGDPRYGSRQINEKYYETFGIRRLLLHAARLVLRQPMTGERIVARAELPSDMVRLLALSASSRAQQTHTH